MQKDRRPGITVEPPIPKAIRSVTDVIVIATPACFIVYPKRFLIAVIALSPKMKMTNGNIYLKTICVIVLPSSPSRVSKLCTITNMSSMPIPSRRNGRIECIELYIAPHKEQSP